MFELDSNNYFISGQVRKFSKKSQNVLNCQKEGPNNKLCFFKFISTFLVHSVYPLKNHPPNLTEKVYLINFLKAKTSS